MVYSAWQLFCLFAIRAAAVSNATIFGPPYVTSFFQELRESFALSYSSDISYVPIPQTTTADTNTHLNAGDPVLVNTLDGVDNTSIVIPMFGFSIAVIHSVPMYVLNLSQSLLVDIFLGKITNWNHTDIVALNPNEKVPNQNISIFTGSLLNRVLEGMSVLANRTIGVSELMNNTAHSYVAEFVCSNVRNKANSIGFTWLAAALEENSQVVRLVNKEGNIVAPTKGVESAMSEYFMAQKNAPPGSVVTPYNMPGQFSWPLISLLYLVLPPNFADCEKLAVVQSFVSFVMFQTSNMDLLAQALGWEPIKSSIVEGHVLGKVTASLDYRDILFSLDCGNKKNTNFHTLGTSAQLAVPILKALAPFTGKVYSNVRMLSADAGIKAYLNTMAQNSEAGTVVDMSFTWVPLLTDYPQLLSVPVYMGGLVIFANVPGVTVILDRPTLAEIFGRRITLWNHSQIRNLNPGANLPNVTIRVLAAASDTVDDSASRVLSMWLRNASSTFNWSQTKSVSLTPQETDIRRYVNYFANSIGYGFTQAVANASQNMARLIGNDGQPITFSDESLRACWSGLDNPKCWPMAIPLAMVLRPATNCSHQRRSVQFVDWMLNNASHLHPFLVPNPDPNNMGAAEFCAGRSLLRTIPEPQALSKTVKIASHLFISVGIVLTIIQAIALGISRKRSELKSASVLFSLLAVVGVLLILLAPLMFVQEKITTIACGTSAWFLSIGFSLCYGSLFAKLFRLYMIFTSRKLVVPRISNKKLMWMVGAFLVIDVILLIIYTAVTPAVPYTFSAMVRSDDDYVTGYRVLTLEMCAFNVDSPVLSIILIFKCLIAVGGAIMAFFIRQVDRRFTSVSALGWSFYNLFLTVVIAIIISIQFDPKDNLQTAMIVPVFCGLWIMYVTLCALALDSNVLLACKDFSRPLRRVLNSGKLSKDRDTTASKSSGEKEQDPDSATKQSQSSTIFVVNREMFPSKYDDFSPELLDQILQELNHQRAAVRRVMSTAASAPEVTTVELAPLGETWRRSSTRADLPSPRLNSKSKVSLAPLSLEASSGNSTIGNSSDTPREETADDRPPAVVIESVDPKPAD